MVLASENNVFWLLARGPLGNCESGCVVLVKHSDGSLVATSFHLLTFSVNSLGESSCMFCSVSKDGDKNSYQIFTKPGSCPAKHPYCVIEALA